MGYKPKRATLQPEYTPRLALANKTGYTFHIPVLTESMSMFTLHPQLAEDTLVVGDLHICRVLLNKQFSQFPWVILVPKRTAVRDLSDLAEQDYWPVMDEVRMVELTLKSLTGADKMNIGALGNVVPQLHIHVIARFKTDDAWPKPVWGNTPAAPYPSSQPEILQKLREALDLSPLSA